MKDGTLQSLGAVETKLLYTLHWIILDAAEECADADFEKGNYQTSTFYYLFSIPAITVNMILSMQLHIKQHILHFIVVRVLICTHMPYAQRI